MEVRFPVSGELLLEELKFCSGSSGTNSCVVSEKFPTAFLLKLLKNIPKPLQCPYIPSPLKQKNTICNMITILIGELVKDILNFTKQQ